MLNVLFSVNKDGRGTSKLKDYLESFGYIVFDCDYGDEEEISGCCAAAKFMVNQRPVDKIEVVVSFESDEQLLDVTSGALLNSIGVRGEFHTFDGVKTMSDYIYEDGAITKLRETPFLAVG